MITLKSQREIALMREAGRLVAAAHRIAREMMQPGVRTVEIDQAVDRFFEKEGATPLFKGVPGRVPYPAATCISINEQVVHGIPGSYRLREGDIVSFDTACRIGGWCGDSAWTYAIGNISDAKQRLMDVGREILRVAIASLTECQRWTEVVRRMERIARDAGYQLVEDLVGHGIGHEMHEDPQVPNAMTEGLRRNDFMLEPGLTLAIEPMLNAGTKRIRHLKDHWTVVTADKKPSVHFEHTVALTADGPLILTEGVGGDLDLTG